MGKLNKGRQETNEKNLKVHANETNQIEPWQVSSTTVFYIYNNKKCYLSSY